MAKWKELGEVPDSDDESTFDSQESQQGLLQPSPAGAADGNGNGIVVEIPAPGNQVQNIWDIPFSSQDSAEGQTPTQNAPVRPPQPPPSSSLPAPSTPNQPNLDLDLDLSPLSSIHDFDDDNDEDDLEDTVQLVEKSIDQSEEDAHQTGQPEPALPQDAPKPYAEAVFEVEQLPGDLGEAAEDETYRYGRSLRPRKPIQEHPYLLESAQYSKTLKSHGVRPVRMRIEEALRKKQEDDFLEQDYEEDSQQTAKDTTQYDTEESQGIRPSQQLDDAGTIPLSSDGPPSPSPRRQTAPLEISLRSSQNDEEEFPDPADIDKWKMKKPRGQQSKRQASPKLSSKRKLFKHHEPVRSPRQISPLPLDLDVFEVPHSPPQTSPALLSRTPVPTFDRPARITTLTPKPSSTISSEIYSPAPANQDVSMIDLTMADEDDDKTEDQEMSSNAGSESESEDVRAAVKRIRGVLPASWLRLDQQKPKKNPHKIVRQRSPALSPDRSHRRGVAQRRQASPKPGHNTALFLEESDDDDDMSARFDDIHESPSNDPIPVFEDDADSVVEEDHIDRMLPSTKRALADGDGLDRPRKRRKDQQSIFKGQHAQPKRQQRITGLLHRTKSAAADSSFKNRRVQSKAIPRRRTETYNREKVRSSAPPRLSILDIVEEDAPSFIRIAARTAKKRSDKGRSSPSNKHIVLGTRRDNIDATGVLRDWKRGHIKPKTSSQPAPNRSRTDQPDPLQPISHNATTQTSESRSKTHTRHLVPPARFSQPRRMIKQASIDNFVNIEAERPFTSSAPNHVSYSSRRPKTQAASALRPAQLETAGEYVGQHAFGARKRALDALYRKSRKVLPTPANVRLEQFVASNVSSGDQQRRLEVVSTVEAPEREDRIAARKRPRPRKQLRPRSLDTSAAQYVHANDPLPRDRSPSDPPSEVVSLTESGGKLLGLGPFGTYYTQHFEIFPLDPGVFFHESTLLGSGRLAKVLDEKSLDGLGRPRGRRTFVLGEKTLQWGRWDAQASSEFGIVFDWIVEYLFSDVPHADLGSVTALGATDFILDYLQGFVTFPESESAKLFIGRFLEVLQSFQQRIDALPANSHSQIRPLIEVLTRVMVINLQALRICQRFNLLSEGFQTEELLKRVAKTTARQLLKTGLGDLQALYDDLQQSSFREKGIRNDHFSVICWVTLIRVLEEARIPRSGFWDIVAPAVLSSDAESSVDAHVFERAWHNLFTLLPLGEFDNAGIVVPGIRHTIPLEGWSIPQRLLKRVFQLYKTNSRQSPSFNDYCRGLVSRCHFLVDQWGWRRCNAIIGTIFDFFAAQDLSHLRNEEVYTSPQFLEHLTGSPSLTILPEDRCFHIFLKLLALSIKRLRKFGLLKDVKNLVARVLPNHNRQHDKEKDVHETELAALRNHHDLLCTLFWAAPAELRPSVQTIEKLVVPASSHKEACLISIRAWCQLSRFVVSSCEDILAYKPFADWQRNMFQQVLEQYLSVESDIQQQFLRMSKDTSRSISEDMKNQVIRMNKKATMDVLHFSMKAFLDVLQQTPTLGAASSALNSYQLDQTFTRLSFSSADSDWSSLRVSLDILDCYLKRIEEFEQSGNTNAEHSWHGEDAIMLLERKIATPYFSMTRGLVSMDVKDTVAGITGERALCFEHAISIAGRIAIRLIHARLSRLSHFFGTGKYHVFQDFPRAITLPSRKYIPLFLSTLMEGGVVDFKDLGDSILDLFLGEIVKPFEYLAYENHLASAMKCSGDPYMKDAIVEMGNSPDYNSNRNLFTHTIVIMRKTLRSVEPSQKQQLQMQFSKSLRTTMDRMKLDLKSMVLNSAEHINHIEFVRSIISLIRSQDLCPVDSFFYQISAEYSPSSQDPRLQTAGILAWGLKLEEGDTKAVSGLFYLLFPSFKLALANNKLANESAILEQAMGNKYVYSFMLGRMFPAVIRTVSQVPEGWLLLDTYVGAFRAQFMSACIHRDIGRDSITELLALVEFIVAGIRHIETLEVFELLPEHLHVLAVMVSLLNLVSPSLAAYLINEPATQTADDIVRIIDTITRFTRAAGVYLSSMLDEVTFEHELTVDPNRLFEGIRGLGQDSSLNSDDEYVDRFTKHMVQDIRDNWVTNGSNLTVRGPSRPQGPSATQSGQGTPVLGWRPRELVRNLNEQVRAWNYANDATVPVTRPNEVPLDDYMF
ncbi:Mus7/MMS22 family-domain-containing protein [Biscogniauxia mediterranea]|nr:Mus7/MMS22 family-domain-containing protein [Biscogniauxia mediterranea]